MLRKKKLKKEEIKEILYSVDREQPKPDRNLTDFLADYNKNLKMVDLGYFMSNNLLTQTEKDKIRKLNVTLLQEAKVVGLKLLNTSQECVEKKEALTKLFKSLTGNLKILSRADHLAFERLHSNNDLEALDLIKSSVVRVHQNIINTADALNDLNAKAYTRRSMVASEDLINFYNEDTNIVEQPAATVKENGIEK